MATSDILIIFCKISLKHRMHMAFCMMLHKMDKAYSFKHMRPESDVVSHFLLSPVSQFPSSSLQEQPMLPVSGVFVYIVCSQTDKSSLHKPYTFSKAYYTLF